MYQWLGLLLAVVLSLVAVQVTGQIVTLNRVLNPRTLSIKRFHNINEGHLVYNYFSDRSTTSAHLQSFHNLAYTARIFFGQPGQLMTVMFDVAAGDIMLLSANHCKFPKKLFNPFCWIHHCYNFQKSQSGSRESDKQSPLFSITHLAGADMQGSLIYDNLKFDGLVIQKATIGVIEHWQHSFTFSSVDGMVGLGLKETSSFARHMNIRNVTPLQAAAIANRPLLSKKLQEQDATKFAFHLFKDKKGDEIGQLLFGTKNMEHRHKDVMWYPKPDKGPYCSPFWAVEMSEIGIVGVGDGVVERIEFRDCATPDPSTSLIAGPIHLIDQIHSQIFRGFRHPKRISKFGTIEFDCRYRDQLPVIVFTIHKRGYFLEPNDYVKQFHKTCTTGFMGLDKLGMLVLGDTFMRKYYVEFDFSTQQIGLAESIPIPIID